MENSKAEIARKERAWINRNSSENKPFKSLLDKAGGEQDTTFLPNRHSVTSHRAQLGRLLIVSNGARAENWEKDDCAKKIYCLIAQLRENNNGETYKNTEYAFQVFYAISRLIVSIRFQKAQAEAIRLKKELEASERKGKTPCRFLKCRLSPLSKLSTI